LECFWILIQLILINDVRSLVTWVMHNILSVINYFYPTYTIFQMCPRCKNVLICKRKCSFLMLQIRSFANKAYSNTVLLPKTSFPVHLKSHDRIELDRKLASDADFDGYYKYKNLALIPNLCTIYLSWGLVRLDSPHLLKILSSYSTDHRMPTETCTLGMLWTKSWKTFQCATRPVPVDRFVSNLAGTVMDCLLN